MSVVWSIKESTMWAKFFSLEKIFLFKIAYTITINITCTNTIKYLIQQMEYTVYNLCKETYNIVSPSKQLQFLAHVACFHQHKQPRTRDFVEGFIFHFLKLFDLSDFVQYFLYCECLFMCSIHIPLFVRLRTLPLITFNYI